MFLKGRVRRLEASWPAFRYAGREHYISVLQILEAFITSLGQDEQIMWNTLFK